MVSDDMRTLLVAEGIGTTSTVYIGATPPSPDTVIAVTEYGGITPTHAFSVALPIIEYPRVQIRTRGAARDYEAPRLLIEQCYQFFVQRGAETVSGGARYMRWTPIQTPFVLQVDENQRWVFAVNFEVWKEMTVLV